MTIEELTNLNQDKRIRTNQITLRLLSEFYVTKVCPYSYSYVTSLGEISLRCSPENFCHLIGLHHFGNLKARTGRNPGLRKHFKGSLGWTNIQNEDITLRALRDIHENMYKEFLDRILYFPFVYQILRSPDIVDFNNLLVKGFSKIEADFLFFHNKKKVRLHIGVRLEGRHYVPVTFKVEYSPKQDRLTQRQNRADIIRIEVRNEINPNEVPHIIDNSIAKKSIKST